VLHTLLQAENRARDEALAIFKEQLLGRRQAKTLRAQLDAAMSKEAKAKRTANVAESSVVCQAHEMTCAKLLASMAGGLQIPSMRQFEGRYKTCLATFEVGLTRQMFAGWILHWWFGCSEQQGCRDAPLQAKCVGPGRSSSANGLQLACIPGVKLIHLQNR
jgi:hypothetical protein